MISIAQAIANMKLSVEQPFVEDKADKNQRRSLFRDLYPYYERDWKRQTWKTYNTWLRANRMKHSSVNQAAFKKTKLYFPKITPASLASFWLCHMKTEDLYYLISIAKDKENRKESFNRWLFWSIKVQPELSTV